MNTTPSAVYDYTQDPEFLNAPPAQQHAYLSANDPDYAKAPPEQQQAYRGHISQHVPTEAEAGMVSPTAPMPQKPVALRASPNLIKPEAGAELDTGNTPEMQGSPVAPMGAALSYPRAALGLVGGTGARTIASQFTNNPWIKDAATVGGGLIGEGSGAAIDDAASKVNFTPKQEITTPIGSFKYNREYPSRGTGAPEPSRAEFEAENEKSLSDRGKLVKLPNRVKPPFEQKLPLPQRAHAEMEGDILQGRQGRAAARDTAYNDLASARNARRGGPEEGEPAPQGSSQSVTRIPEPNKPAPGENPNNQQSVPRKTTLIENAKRAKEGAGTQLNQIHGPVLYEPRGAGYSGVREQVPLGGEAPIVKGGSEGTIGNTQFKSMPSAGEQSRSAFHAQLEKDTGISVHDFVDQIQSKNPNMSRGDAYSLAESTLRDLNSPNSIEQQSAQQRYQRLSGPEQRGPVRMGPEARGIK